MKENKKGFTLVELLAVIVILALLIVVTANTILPMLGKTKEKAMIVYTNKVLKTADEMFTIDSMYNNLSYTCYSIEEIMGQKDYFGFVVVNNNTNPQTNRFAIFIFNNDIPLFLQYVSKSTDITKIKAERTISNTEEYNNFITENKNEINWVDFCEGVMNL